MQLYVLARRAGVKEYFPLIEITEADSKKIYVPGYGELTYSAYLDYLKKALRFSYREEERRDHEYKLTMWLKEKRGSNWIIQWGVS